jgi:hypothetical protein
VYRRFKDALNTRRAVFEGCMAAHLKTCRFSGIFPYMFTILTRVPAGESARSQCCPAFTITAMMVSRWTSVRRSVDRMLFPSKGIRKQKDGFLLTEPAAILSSVNVFAHVSHR